ncbi:MAG TPA: DUF5715 family protein [Longimicrobiaceae bacterium]|nr:DUF5715 family protein [Longimicrobiaceae bacterium]
MRRWTAAGLVGVLAAGGCARGEHEEYDGEVEEPQGRPAAAVTAVDSARVRARIAAEGDSVRAAFGRVRRLRWREVWGLRRDVNAEQIATAERLGVRASDSAEIVRLVREGRLVALGDSTPHWVLRRMEHSVPYVTPDARAMLVELGRRFHARLDSLGLPLYRMKITSALRTDEAQAELRRINPNASRTVSAHEFGTTVDVSHERFAVPAEPGNGDPPGAAPAVRQMEVEMLEGVGKENARALQAELGRAIAEMRGEGALQVMMEDRQPVYHMTVARRFPAAN